MKVKVQEHIDVSQRQNGYETAITEPVLFLLTPVTGNWNK